MAVTAIVVVGSGVELIFEQHARGTNIHNFGESLWWAIVTVTTVGYGHNYPVTTGGRCVAVVIMLVGDRADRGGDRHGGELPRRGTG